MVWKCLGFFFSEETTSQGLLHAADDVQPLLKVFEFSSECILSNSLIEYELVNVANIIVEYKK